MMGQSIEIGQGMKSVGGLCEYSYLLGLQGTDSTALNPSVSKGEPLHGSDIQISVSAISPGTSTWTVLRSNTFA
jgi:hypothetical protein